MAVHKAKNKTSAKRLAARYRRKGLNATIAKTKSGYKMYTDQKGRR